MQNGKKRLGVMIDMSRNAVMSVKALKEYIAILAKMGYNALMLYTEDTYEIEGEPYFGYLRGRYSAAELGEVQAACEEKGIELIPCIQTLAHLDAIMRWPAYKAICDTGNILLADDERTYAFLDRMFTQIEKVFHSRVCHIGMDEAHMLGLGKYLDLHGYHDRFALLTRHLEKVCELAKKHGFAPVMWSDMFFRIGNHGVYSSDDPQIPDDLPAKIHPDVTLTYWEYYSAQESRYDAMFAAHEKLGRPIWFAGGAWTWTGFAPHNRFSVAATRAALASARRHGVDNIFLTVWGDNGGECSRLAVLPALWASAEFYRGNTDAASIRAGFEKEFGIPFEAVCDLDLWTLPVGKDSAASISNPDKYLLYADPLLGMTDSTLAGGEGEIYRAFAKKLAPYASHPLFGRLFREEIALCDALSVKAELGVRLREAYQKGDRAALEAGVADLLTAKEKTAAFLREFRAVWMAENKPHGFAVQEIRLGGLIERLESSADRLRAYLDGGEAIPELEEKILDFAGGGENFGKKPLRIARYNAIASADNLGERA